MFASRAAPRGKFTTMGTTERLAARSHLFMLMRRGVSILAISSVQKKCSTNCERYYLQTVEIVSCLLPPLVRPVRFCPLDEFRRHRFAKCGTRLVVHFIVDTSPDAGIARLFANRADELRMAGKQVRQDLASGS